MQYQTEQKKQVKQARQGTSHLVLSEYQRKQVNEFEDMSHEFRRLFSEFLGTFFLVLTACGAPAVAGFGGSVSRAAEVTAPGLMVAAIILFMGTNSGAHLNPVVTLAFSLRGDFHWKRVPGYVVAQVLGAVAAPAVLRMVFGPSADLGLTVVGPHFSPVQGFAVEALLTFGLISVVLGAASGAQNIGPLAALAAGSYIVLAGLWGSPVSGASMNRPVPSDRRW
nr:aquaporin [Sinomonas humi]